eukprot:evm.model.scf_2237.2 EVM.evm.TU.scf_2237.2   scf_2237:5315-8297(-)
MICAFICTVLQDCMCSADGSSEGVDTGSAGCQSGSASGIVLCYVASKAACEAAGMGADSHLFPGAWWMLCEGTPAVQDLKRDADVPPEEQEKLDEELLRLVPAAVNASTIDRIRELLLSGADPNAPFRTETVLHLAAGHGDVAAATMLVEAGAEIDAQDDLGSTPLHLASAFGKVGVARLLVVAGADVGRRDGAGQSARQVICSFAVCSSREERQLGEILS